jgi:hypothetical protein
MTTAGSSGEVSFATKVEKVQQMPNFVSRQPVLRLMALWAAAIFHRFEEGGESACRQTINGPII